ncbi:antitoxin [Nocardioides sp.]|uniref:antitoxin n=1 Tax=Nocardioides sp. TaxID=35761 RepID=UPI0039E7139E
MSFLDKAKDAVKKAVDSQGEKIGEGLDKAGDLVDDKTGGKYSDNIDEGVDKAKDALDGLDGSDDDI